MANQKDASTLAEAGKKVGKALARSSHKMEETGQKMKKAGEKLVKEAAGKAGKTVESAMGTIKKEVSELSRKKKPGTTGEKGSLFKPAKEMTVEAQIGFLAGDIFEYLNKNGPTPVAELANVMKTWGTLPLLGAALGWLAREAKIVFSPCGTKVSLL